ncbi:MAG: PAAR domain-containing protein [Myxococcales bacterium]|nr:PAAR domain-containing protein [Myxococcales bacterium]
MKPAARLSDPCMHGGMLASGSPDTTVGGMPAARLGDIHTCPIPGHVAGKLVSASSTVFINGQGAARVADTIACASPAAPPAGKTHKAAAEYKVKDDDNYLKAVYAEHVSSDFDKDGHVDTHKVGVGVFSASGETVKGKGPVTYGARGKYDVATASAYAGASFDKGGSVRAGAKAVLTSAEGSVFVGPKGDDGKNPYAEVGAQGQLLGAEAKGDVLLGDDGKRVGVLVGGKASASAMGGEARGRVGIPLWPGSKYSLDIKVGVSGDLGAVGGSLAAGGYYDKEEGRTHFIFEGALKLLAGLGLSLDISIGRKFGVSAPAPAPDAVAVGCTSVFIGG